MIMNLEYSGQGKRGGEKYHAHLHSFLVENFEDVIPVKLRELPPALFNPIKHARYNLRLVKKHRPDLIVVDVSSSSRNLLAVRWMKANKKRVLVVVQGQRLTFRYNNALARWLVCYFENYLLKSADIVLANSKYCAELAGHKGKGKPGIVIAPPGLEVEPISSNGASVGATETEGPIKLLFVGECSYRKGVKPLIEALAMLKDLNIHLDVAGRYFREDRYFKEIQGIIERNSLKNRVTFLGFTERSNLDKLYRQCSVFVCPSLSEGYGMALAEAVVYGLPIVATTAGAIPEMVTNDVNGLLVKPGDPRALAAAIAKLVADHSLRTAISKANLKRAASLSKWDGFHQILLRELAPAINNAIEH